VIIQKIRRSGNSYVVTVPREEIERQGLREGDIVGVEFRKMELRPALTPSLRAAAERSWKRNEAAYRYLAEH
jgi:antitoxin component of MazEF toxin-antitoxin module